MSVVDLDVDRRAAASADVVDLRQVTAGYGDQPVLTAVDLRVRRGELVGLVGPSGAGKTTLLRLLTAGADRHRGSIRVLGDVVRRGRPGDGIGYVPQLDTIDPAFPLTVRQVVLLGDAATSGRVPWFSRDERRSAAALLERLGLGPVADRPLGELSGGQRQRMMIARALHRRPDLLLLDEPTSGVDPSTRRDLLGLLFELHAEGLTVVLTTHDLNAVATRLPRIVCIAGGSASERGGSSVVADGAPARVLTPNVLERTYGAPMRIIRDGGRIVVVDPDPPAVPAVGAS
jgi:ABC-type Mn2+/Zn2+ transport system ATPase subunit